MQGKPNFETSSGIQPNNFYSKICHVFKGKKKISRAIVAAGTKIDKLHSDAFSFLLVTTTYGWHKVKRQD